MTPKILTIHIKHFQKSPNAFEFWREAHHVGIDIPSRKRRNIAPTPRWEESYTSL
jgi:hypothetical protein